MNWVTIATPLLALAGALIGGAVGGGRGALIGALIGGMAGLVIADAIEKERAREAAYIAARSGGSLLCRNSSQSLPTCIWRPLGE